MQESHHKTSQNIYWRTLWNSKESHSLVIRNNNKYKTVHHNCISPLFLPQLDDKSFEEYVKVVKIKNVPKKLLSEGLYNLLNDEQ